MPKASHSRCVGKKTGYIPLETKLLDKSVILSGDGTDAITLKDTLKT